jgi:hypothetical protein
LNFYSTHSTEIPTEPYDVKKDLSDKKKRVLTFGNMIHRGMQQSERIIVEDCKIGRFYAKRNIYNRVHRDKQNIKEVYIRTETGLELLYSCAESTADALEQSVDT